MTSDDAADPRTEPEINAHPTKSFFIEMLTRDIPLNRAIIELADNAVDAAQAMAAEAQSDSLSAYAIHVQVSPDELEIRDTCGGIPPDLARNYAFRFGRAPNMPVVPGSIGQFGVGMKRALFKLGDDFRIVSCTRTSRFVVEVSVPEWEEDQERWGFDFKELDEHWDPPDGVDLGTEISVTNLKPLNRERFGNESMLSDLRQQLFEAEATYVQRGLILTFNGIPAHSAVNTLLQSASIHAANEEFNLGEIGSPEVRVHLVAGLGESSPREAGWSIYCNGRLVIDADRTATTVWGLTEEEPIPQYHNQFARFRGFAFFESADAGLLPWNTTKTGVDTDHPAYGYVRRRMILITRPVIDFLNQLKYEEDLARDQEAQGYEPKRPLGDHVAAASPTPLASITLQPFAAPAASPSSPSARSVSIQYRRPVPQVEALKRALQLQSAREVGEWAFDYLYQEEVGQQ